MKGGSTGAITQQRGKLEAADGGTVFLNWVNYLLHSGKTPSRPTNPRVDRLGGTGQVKVDVRVIAARTEILQSGAGPALFEKTCITVEM